VIAFTGELIQFVYFTFYSYS